MKNDSASKLCQHKRLVVALVTIFSGSLLTIMYNSETSIYRNYLKAQQKYIQSSNENYNYFYEESVISNIGCRIPNPHFNETVKIRKSEDEKFSCGIQAVNLFKENPEKAYFKVNESSMKIVLKGKQLSHCCYYEIARKNDVKNSLSACRKFTNITSGILGNSEFYVIECFSTLKNKKFEKVYWDSFAMIRKNNSFEFEPNVDKNIKFRKNTDNTVKKISDDVNSEGAKIIKNSGILRSTFGDKCEKKIPERHNVLILGIDTMSRWRYHTTMPYTLEYLRHNGWFEFRGYQKTGQNTFPNIMALLAGLNSSSSYNRCRDSIEKCKDMLIWRRFAAAGFVTAYGEDYIALPDTFKGGFNEQPTIHYMRPMFISGESKIKSHGENGVCSGSLLSGEKILDFATDFITTYKNSSSFGFFWMNSFSHNEGMSPNIMDSKLKRTLVSLNSENITENTVIILLGDHGVRFGKERQTLSSYYDERLPALFMWIPNSLRRRYPEMINNMKINTGRLTTPYDMYSTLHEILAMSCGEKYPPVIPLACSKCLSLFKEIPATRTCKDAGIDQNWCVCHDAKPILQFHGHSMDIVNHLLEQINKKVSKDKVKPCYVCANFKVKKILRIHYYQENDNLFYIVAIQLTPGDGKFEATVMESTDGSLKVIGNMDVISMYHGKFGNCLKTKYASVQQYCFCLKENNCLKP